MNQGIWATIVGVVVLVFGSIGVFRELRNALNTMWGIEVEEVKGLWNSLKHLLVKNLLSFTMVLGVGFILLVSLMVSTALTALNGIVNSYIKLPQFLTGFLNTLVTLAIITFVFALLFKYLPETKVAWGDVFLGGFVTALLFLIGKFAIGIYLGNSSVGTTFGAAGSLALLLIWVYYSAQILFFGAEFTQVYANRYGSKIGVLNDSVATSNLPSKQNKRSSPYPSPAAIDAANAMKVVGAVSEYPRSSLPFSQNETLGFAVTPEINQRTQEAKKAASMLVGLVVVSFVSGLLTKIGIGRQR